MHGWQSEPTDGSKGGWGFEPLILSLFVSCSFLSNCLYLFAWLCVHPFLMIYHLLSLSMSLSPPLSTYLSIHQSMYLAALLSIHLSICSAFYHYIYRSSYPSFCLSIWQSLDLSIIFMYVSNWPSIHPPIHVSPTPFMAEPSSRNIDKEVAAEAENENRQQHLFVGEKKHPICLKTCLKHFETLCLLTFFQA